MASLPGEGNTISVHFSVSDSRIGIEPQYIENLFTPFTQEDDSTTRRHRGSGLGESICKRLVESIGGEIGVDNEKNVGSTFWFVQEMKTAERKQAVVKKVPCPKCLPCRYC
jgi:signal transduction histidine kinase